MSTFNIYKQYDDDLYYLSLISDRFQRQNSEYYRFTSHLGIIPLDQVQENINSFPKNRLIDSLNGPYPIAVRYMDKGVFLVERPPFQMKIDYSPTKSNRVRRPIKPVTVWVPWTVSVYNLSSDVNTMLNSYKIYFNDSSISSLEDRLITNYFCNVYGDGKICLGRSAQGVQDKLQNNEITDFATLHSYMFNEYFSGGWNTDLGSNLYSLMKTIDSSYMIKDYTDLSDSSIDARAKKLKLKFFKSHHPAYEIANSFYNLSLLSLEETLNMVTEVKQKHFHQVKTINSIVASDVDSSVDNYLDPINFTDNYSKNYCNVKIILDNTLNATNLNSRDIPSEILQFFKENSYNIIDQVYESYNSRNSMSIELNYEIPLISPSSIEEHINV